MKTSKKKPAKPAQTAAPAKGKAKKKVQPKTAAKPAAAAASDQTVYDPSHARVAIKQVHDKWGSADAKDTKAFAASIDADARADLGGRTKSTNVLSAAARYASLISQAFDENESIVEEHYSPRRFRYLLDASVALGTLVAKEEAKRKAPGARGDVATVEQAARTARNTLVAKLRAFAGARKPYVAKVSAVLGDTSSTVALGQSIQALVVLARSFIALDDETNVVLRETSGLTDAVVDAALAAGRTLTGTAADATNAPAATVRDTPAINLQEGTVIHELRVARAAFEEAHEATLLVARLPIPRGLEAVMGSKRASDDRSAPSGGSTSTGGGNTQPGGGSSPTGGGNTQPGGGSSPTGGGNTQPGGGNTSTGDGSTQLGGGNTPID